MLLAGVVSCGPGEAADVDAKGNDGKPRAQVIETAGRAPRVENAGAVQLEFQQGCEKVKAVIEDFLDQGLDSIGCWESAKPPKAETRAGAPGEIATQAGLACRVKPGHWWYTRFDACGRMSLTYTVIDLKTKRPRGRADFTATQEIKLRPKTGTVGTKNTLTLDRATGWAKGLTAQWRTSCSGGACASAAAWPGARPIGKGGTLGGSATQTWTAKAPVQSFRSKTMVTIRGAGHVLLSPAGFAPPMKIRCDKTFNSKKSSDGKSRGCVFPSVPPTLQLDLTHEGHANVAWSMRNLKGHWGWQGRGKPLSREADTAVQQANRNKVCDSSFKPDPRVADDSCDEFPFAATRQSGGQFGLRGKDCAEIRPEKKNGKWLIHYVNNVTPSSRCTIGHVPGGPNKSVGGSLSRRLYQNQRVIDGEKFWLRVG